MFSLDRFVQVPRIYADSKFLLRFYNDQTVHPFCGLFLFLDHAVIFHSLEFFLDQLVECYWYLSGSMDYWWHTWVKLDVLFTRKTN